MRRAKKKQIAVCTYCQISPATENGKEQRGDVTLEWQLCASCFSAIRQGNAPSGVLCEHMNVACSIPGCTHGNRMVIGRLQLS
jgi:hypothetical protein